MKNAKKLLGMVLSLCLVLSSLAGVAVMAEDGNLLPQTGWHSYDTGGKIDVPQDGLEFPFNGWTNPDSTEYKLEAPSFPAELMKTYRLSFEYMLPEGGVMQYHPLPITDKYSGLWDIGFAQYQTLKSTGNKFVKKTFSFTVEDVRVAKIQVDFRVEKNDAISTPAVVRNIEVRLLEDGASTNGSFEMTRDGVAVDTAGGQLVTEGALFGNNMMKITKDSPMSLELFLNKASQNAKLRAYAKTEGFTAESVAVFTVKSADGDVLSEKKVNLAPQGEAPEDNIWNIKEDAWDYIRISGLPYSDGMTLTVSVEGAGALYVDGITFEADKNLLKNARFDNSVGETEWGNASWYMEQTAYAGENTVYLGNTFTEDGETVTPVKMDGNCPDGQTYVASNGSGYTFRLVPIGAITAKEGEKYRLSVWISGDMTVRIWHNETEKANVQKEYPGFDYPMLDVANNSTWKQISYTFTVPKGMTQIQLALRTATYLTTEQTVRFNMPCIEKVEENEVGFYNQSYMPGIEPQSRAFQNILGAPLETAVGYYGWIHAVATTVKPLVTSNASVIMAAYKKTEDGKKTLTAIKLGSATAPAVDTMVTDSNNNPVLGVNYPTTSMHTDEMRDATEIRAFLWDSVSGLTSVGNPCMIAR